MSEINQEYFKHMISPTMEGIREVAPGEVPILGWLNMQQQVTAQLGTVDWEATGLPNRFFAIEDNQVEKTPEEAAKYLMDLAFNDAFWLTQISEEFVKGNSAAQAIPMAELLKNSKQNLLLYSRLEDGLRGQFHTAIEVPQLASHIADAPIDAFDPLLLARRKGRVQIDWSPSIREWYDASLDNSRGCPAFKEIVEVEGKPTQLIYYFWDQLTNAMYERAVGFTPVAPVDSE